MRDGKFLGAGIDTHGFNDIFAACVRNNGRAVFAGILEIEIIYKDDNTDLRSKNYG
jgi:hypothetical protein